MNSYLLTCNPTFSRQLLKEMGLPGMVVHPGVLFVEALDPLKEYILAHDIYHVQKKVDSLDREQIVDILASMLSLEKTFLFAVEFQ